MQSNHAYVIPKPLSHTLKQGNRAEPSFQFVAHMKLYMYLFDLHSLISKNIFWIIRPEQSNAFFGSPTVKFLSHTLWEKNKASMHSPGRCMHHRKGLRDNCNHASRCAPTRSFRDHHCHITLHLLSRLLPANGRVTGFSPATWRDLVYRC